MPRAQFDQAKKTLENQLAALQDENKRNLAQITPLRGQLASPRRRPRARSKKSKPSDSRPTQLRDAAVGRREAGKRITSSTRPSLNDKIRELERQLETATKNNSDLRETRRQVLDAA